VIFPSGSAGEDWRLLAQSWSRHFVVSGGKIIRPAGEAG